MVLLTRLRPGWSLSSRLPCQGVTSSIQRGFRAAPPRRKIPETQDSSIEGLVYPEAPTASHHDLPSFLRHAEATGLDPESTVFVGTRFEYVVAASLARLGFSLRRVGGASDHGIDLLGAWAVPSSPRRPLRVLVQCKAVQRPGPHLVRELEGAFAGAPPGWRGAGVLGLLVAERPATKGIRDALGRSTWPMGFASCSREGAMRQMLWNHRAEQEGLEGMGVAARHSGDGGETTIALTWNGKHLPERDVAQESLG